MAMPLINAIDGVLDGIVQQLDPEKFYTVMRRAQRDALTEWRDRKQFPGMAARFDPAGQKGYNFQPRLKATVQRKHGAPAWVNTSAMRNAIMGRKPKSLNIKGSRVAKTIFLYGANAVNALTNIKTVASEQRVPIIETISVRAYQQSRHNKARGSATLVQVRGYLRQHKGIHRLVQRTGTTYAQEWANLNADMEWIKARVPVIFMALVKRLIFDKRGNYRLKYAPDTNIAFGED